MLNNVLYCRPGACQRLSSYCTYSCAASDLLDCVVGPHIIIGVMAPSLLDLTSLHQRRWFPLLGTLLASGTCECTIVYNWDIIKASSTRSFVDERHWACILCVVHIVRRMTKRQASSEKCRCVLRTPRIALVIIHC